MTTLTLAETAFNHAQAVDTFEAWQEAAKLLFKIRKRLKAPPKSTKFGRDCRYPFPIVKATSADGTVIRRTFYSRKGKPIDFDRATRIAKLAYSFGRNNRPWPRRIVTVPPIVRLVEITTGQTA